jgi:NAD(P)-dependent dehydrogenase (short-subunit alcohol dehydrogenase family)
MEKYASDALPLPSKAAIIADTLSFLRLTARRGVVVATYGPGFVKMLWPKQRDGNKIQRSLAHARSVLLNTAPTALRRVERLPPRAYWVIPKKRDKMAMVVVCAAELADPRLESDWWVT